MGQAAHRDQWVAVADLSQNYPSRSGLIGSSPFWYLRGKSRRPLRAGLKHAYPPGPGNISRQGRAVPRTRTTPGLARRKGVPRVARSALQVYLGVPAPQQSNATRRKRVQSICGLDSSVPSGFPPSFLRLHLTPILRQIGLRDPGGPTINMLCPLAAAASRGRFACSCPFTSP